MITSLDKLDIKMNFILLQETAQKLPNSAPEATFTFWFASQVFITLLIFVGVYIILKPVLGKKDEEDNSSE